MRPLIPFSIAIAILILILTVGAASGQSSDLGAVAGRVVSAGDSALSGAAVIIQDTGQFAVTDPAGAFRITGIPVGRHTLEVTYLGFDTQSLEVEILLGVTASPTIVLRPSHVFDDAITVRAEPLLEGQSKALNQQKNAANIKSIVAADQIGRFPDPNGAEATQRISGVTVQRDQGEGRYVLVRGSDPSLSAAAINGVRVPSPEGDVRYVALDVIPADLLESIEISKAVTPDMDGDAIGGNVNLLTKRPTGDARVAFTAALGYNDIVSDTLTSTNVSVAKGFLEDRLGILLAASYHNTNRGTDAFEAEWNGDELEDFQLRDYTINRKRYGFTASLDHQLSQNSELYVRGIFNHYSDLEIRRRNRSRLDKDRLERELKERLEIQRIGSVGVGGLHVFPSFLQLDYEVSWSYAEEDEPNRLDTTFRQKNVDFSPIVGQAGFDPNNIQTNPLNEDLERFVFDDAVIENNFTEDRDLTAAVNLSRPFTGLGISGRWKSGVKFRFKRKNRDIDVFVYETDDDIFLRDFTDASFNAGDFLDGRYEVGDQIGVESARGLFDAFDLNGDKDLEEDLADFDATEDTSAAYGMADLSLSSKARFLVGARYEYTDVNYTGRELVLDEDGDIGSTSPVSGDNSYGDLLPMAHFVYSLSSDSNLRAAVTRTFARPNYSDLVPFRLINREDNEIRRGNPTLQPTKSWNFDILGEKYFSTVGVISAGVFFKSMTDNIFISRFEELQDGEDFEVTQARNLETANLLGLEAAYQAPFRFLPSPLDGLGVYTNVTFTRSSADIPGRDELDNRLPGQAQTVGNFALFYEKYGFSGRVSANYHGEYLFTVGSDPSRDVYVDRHLQIDVSMSQRLAPKVRLFAEIVNLNNEPLRLYEGTLDRPIRVEYYSWWSTFGIKWDF